MSFSAPRHLLEKASIKITQIMGLAFSGIRFHDLEKAFKSAAKDLGYENIEDCINWFLEETQSQRVTEVLAAYLTIGETYFLRENRHYEVLEQIILPEILQDTNRGKRSIRFWSAGCATGEEAYSIAITLHRMGYLLRDWDVSILATDINLLSLDKAMKGIYSRWSFRNEPDWLIKNYFKCMNDGRYEIIPEIKRMVNFEYLNLADGGYPSLLNGTNALDVIFCRNVLMYFSPERVYDTLERFHQCLVDDGVMVVSACETSNLSSSKFTAVNYPDAILYRKKRPVITLVEPLLSPCHLPHLAPNKNKQPILTPSDNIEAKVLLCRALANEGRLDEALELSEQILVVDKLNVDYHYLHAMILLEQDEKESAQVALRKILFLDNKFVFAYFMLGNISRQLGENGEAKKHFQNAVNILKCCPSDEEVPNSEGLQAGKLSEMIQIAIDSL